MTMPTEQVGSLPRPVVLQSATAEYDQGRISREAFLCAQDDACQESIERMEATGSPVVSDGEQRKSSFATYPLADTLAGTGLADHLSPDGQYFAFFDDGHSRRLPRLTGGPFRYRNSAADYLERSLPMAQKPMKQAVIAPSMLSLLYPLDGQLDGYSHEEFLDDLCDEAEADIRKTFAAGATRVSIDFTEGRLASKNDPRNPWTNRSKLAEFIELNSRVIDRFSVEERRNIGIHTCPGGDCDSVHSADVDYAALLPSMFEMNAGYFLIQVASEKDRDRVYELCGRHSREDAHGVAQVCFVGVIDPLDPRVESAQEVRDALLRAARYIPKERLGSTDDCGFSPFSVDVKPKHGSPDVARDIAFQKITARVQGTRMASERLGI